MRTASLVSARRRWASGGFAAAVVLVALLWLAAPAGAIIPPSAEEEGQEQIEPTTLVPDRSGVVAPGAPFAWTGAVATARNVAFNAAEPGSCGKAPETYCDITLVEIQPGAGVTRGQGVAFTTGGAAPGTDLDLYVYASDPSGHVIAPVAASGGPTDAESVEILDASGFFLVVVTYFNATETGYTGTAEFFQRATVAADVDRPSGMQDVLVSRPSRGFRSHSEPHLSQDPTNPRILVGGSKMYNRDRDSLAEYEFKIGTYASFDRGRSWTDLGQLNTCPLAQAPRSSWPLRNRCYPADDPARAGTGGEDQADGRPGGDLGEEYTTSDVWTGFDDEGNAYAMVLDSPPFSGDSTGNGFGMSFHRWETPSLRDIRRGQTWSRRIPINAYTGQIEQATTLDDKNTFAINNAGPDHDGRIGIMVACWGKNFDLPQPGRQEIVCERSTDGGRSWPGEPRTISPPLNPPLPFGPFVVGVHVVASERDPQTFYAVWLDTLTGFVDGSQTNILWFARTTDGARTWSQAKPIGRILPVPNAFPRQGFRNLSLPIMAAARSGDLYVTYADYNIAPDPATDIDVRQADVKLIRSGNGGRSWSAPIKVNTDTTNADQFQPYVRVTPRGQLNVTYFDRRFDPPQPPVHPGNFFVDTVLARSNDGGRTFRETRLTHDSWDPSLNPPISPSGQFIGDYEGLVADDCFAIPFVNDAHLGNDASRDPQFDRGKPRTPFQQIVAWRVPNLPAFGGRRQECAVPRR
jgi:hypothetical protein